MPPKRLKEDDPKDLPGTFIFPDKSVFDGVVCKVEGNGENTTAEYKRYGNGTYKDSTTFYSGSWFDDAMHGKGSIQYESGASYVGQFYFNQYDGYGVYKWPDGSHYKGYWQSNLMHGEGAFFAADGSIWIGKFYRGLGTDLQQIIK